MNFLRKNIFYVALLGAVVAALIIVLLASPSANTDAKTQLKEKIEALQKDQPVNDLSIQTEKARIENTAKQVSGVINLCIDHNRKDFKVVEYPHTNTPIFPFHKDVYDKNLAEIYELTTQYQATLDKMKKALGPTTPPTDADLAKETKRQEQMLKISGTAAAGTAITPPVFPGIPTPGGTNVADFTTPAGSAIRMQNASAGAIYIPEGALDVCLTRPMPDIPPSELWEMQLNLVVHNEIFSAIGGTIDFVLQGTGGPAKPATVPNSPIKMLYKVLIDKSYVTTGGPVAATAAPIAPAPGAPGAGGAPNFVPPGAGGAPNFVPPGAMGGGGPLGGGGPMGGGPMGSGPRTGRPTGGGPRYTGGTTAGPLTAVPTGPSMGDRTSNKDYDVIRYSFQVVMPVRYVPLLERKLMERNFNTVLNFDLADVDPSSPTFAPCYFGSDPVMLVTIHAQLLLMTAWERGSWELDKDGKKVEKYPPLMPTDVLKTFPADALRAEDTERINQPS